jgi:hypothetical protein
MVERVVPGRDIFELKVGQQIFEVWIDHHEIEDPNPRL